MKTRIITTFLALLLAATVSATFLASQAVGQISAERVTSGDTKSLPIWTQPDAESLVRLGDTVRRLQDSIIFVGHPKGGSGTAFVVSREHRLLATNAHVADIRHDAGAMVAIVPQTGAEYKVERVWYHPGVVRRAGGTTGVLTRSEDPALGPTYPVSPDVALLQLAPGGPELPAALKLASPAELRELFAQPLAMVGFPGHDMPDDVHAIRPTYHQGVVSRLTDFNTQPVSDWRYQQFLQHTALGLGGFSGSPLFLANGHVVGLHNSFRRVEDRGFQAGLSHGVRIDCLWELIAHHGLENMLPLPLPKSDLDLARYTRPDPAFEKYRQVVALVLEADYLNDQRQFGEAAAKCKEAIALLPSYPQAYATRLRAFTNYAFTYRDRISDEVFLQQVTLAAKDAEKYLELAPSDPRAPVFYAKTINNVAAAQSRLNRPAHEHQANRRKVLAIVEQVLKTPSLPDRLRAEALSARAVARAALEDFNGALADFREVIRLDPSEPTYYEERAQLYDLMGRRQEARADTNKAEELRAARDEGVALEVAWQSFSPGRNGFSVELPSLPVPMAVEAPKFPYEAYLTRNVTLGLTFVVAYGDLPDDVRRQYPTDADVLDMVTSLLFKEHQVLSEKSIEVAGLAARELEVAVDAEKFLCRHIVDGSRFYLCLVGGLPQHLANNAPSARRFVESFRLASPPQPPASVATWHDFRSDRGGFRIQFPGQPEAETSQGEEYLHHSFMVVDQARQTAFVVDYVDFSDEQVVQHDTPDKRLDFVRGRMVGSDTLQNERRFVLAGHRGRDLVVDQADGRRIVARLYSVDRRLYQIAVVGPAEAITPEAEPVRRFIDSFALLPVMETDSPTDDAWRRVEVADAGVAVMMPGAPKHRPADGPGKFDYYSLLRTDPSLGSMNYLVGYLKLTEEQQLTRVADERLLGRSRNQRASSSELLAERPIELAGRAGIELHFKTDKVEAVERLYVAGDRLVQAMVMFAVGRRPAAEKEITRFFDSVEWIGTTADGLQFLRVEARQGPLGPLFPSLEGYPYETLDFRTYIANARRNAQGEFEIAWTVALKDSQGQVLKSDRSSAHDKLTESRLIPFSAHATLPAEPGQYLFGVTMTDISSGEQTEFVRRITVKPEAFAIVNLRCFRDEKHTVPAADGGTVGETLHVEMKVIGFDRSQGQINTTMNMQLLDPDGKPLLPQSVGASVEETDAAKVASAPYLVFNGTLPLTTAGNLTLRITVFDRIGNNVVKLERPLQVNPR